MEKKTEVVLIKENDDGSADYMFNLPPDSVAAFARLGIMTAIQAGFDGAKRYEPDNDEPPAPTMDANIKRLAIEAGFIAWEDEEWHPADVVFDWAGADDESLVNFYHLVRKEAIAKEREACAATCENNQAAWTESEWNDACARCAEAIRGRFAQ
jgi:hypothetical protein